VAKHEKKMICPECDEKQDLTYYQTLLHQLQQPCTKELVEDSAYYFCRNQSCDVVYFDTEGHVFTQKDVRWQIGQKMTSPSRQICYCFDVTYDEVSNEFTQYGSSKTKEFVMAQTKAQNCACEIRNPSGKCCLVDFPKGRLCLRVSLKVRFLD
jgi:hypothetical protein